MASADVVASAILLHIPVVSFLLFLYSLLYRSTHLKRALFILVAILAAVAAASALSVACGQPLRIVAKTFTVLLHSTLSAISIYALSPSTHGLAPPFLGFSLSLAALLVGCELISALIPTSPILLSATFALVSRGILLAVAVATAALLHRRHATNWCIEKGKPVDGLFSGDSGRVSSPTQATWPFPGSLALQDRLEPALSFPLATRTHHMPKDAYTVDGQNFVLLPLVLVITQIFATLVGAMSVAASILVDATTDHPVPRILVANAACTLLWSFAALAIIQILPAGPCPYLSEKQVAMGYEQGLLGDDTSKFSAMPRTPKPSLTRRGSDSMFDFLSLRDPFASSPPAPPPLPPVGLGLDEVDVGWNGNEEIGLQYRFPAPRSVVKGGRRKGKNSRVNGKRCQSRTLLPVPETRGAETDLERDRVFGDEARLAQLLLQSLCEGKEDFESLSTSTPVPILRSPQAVHVQQSSRWSTSTTVQSVLSTSISNRSGVSTYTTCASERVPPSRISMNTIASVLGSRKSVETKRKSGMTASSSKC